MQESQYSVLVFSKYSQNCKRLLDTISNSGVNFSNLQLLCIDNDKVRQRILENDQFNITVVPSILCVYSNGNVEAYEGSNAFNWVHEIITQLTPTPPPPAPLPPQPSRIFQPVEEETQVNQDTYNQEEENYEPPQRKRQPENNNIASRSSHSNDPKGLGEDPDIPPHMSPKEIANLQRVIEDRGDVVSPQRGGETKVKTRPKMERRESVEPRKVPSRMKPIGEPVATSIDDIPYEDDDVEEDRHRTVRQPRRIRQDEGNYQEDDSLFAGEIIDNRKEPGNTVKTKAQKSTKEANNIKSKADALALERETAEKQINKPAMRSDSEFRRP